MAGLRLLLGAEPGKEIASLSALTNQTQPYLPPVDTADVIMRTTSGVTGVFQISRGTSLLTDELAIACSNGWIKLENETVTISRDGKVEVVTVPNERTGVLPEIRVWGSSIIEGKARPEQEPEAALADLELVRSTVHQTVPRAQLIKYVYRLSSSSRVGVVEEPLLSANIKMMCRARYYLPLITTMILSTITCENFIFQSTFNPVNSIRVALRLIATMRTTNELSQQAQKFVI
jgi:hypothetical protein